MFISLHNSHHDFPKKINELQDPPRTLYAKGKLELLACPAIGIVGSRKMTSYGRRIITSIIPPLVQAGCAIISGLAFGVDYEAHKCTLQTGGKAIAVLGSGIDDITPRSNEILGKAIEQKGLLLSEYPGSTPAHKSHFPARNRIIAGLSDVLVVIEGSMRSGSLITADFMMQLGRDVFAVPGNIDAPLSMGTNFLCSNGAQMLLNADDILTHLGFDKNTRPRVSSDVSSEEQHVLDLLGKRLYTIDELCEESTLSLETILKTITDLEIKKIISRSSDGTFTLT